MTWISHRATAEALSPPAASLSPGSKTLPTRRPRVPAPRSGGGAYGPPPQPNPWLIGLAVAVVLAAVSIIAFGFLAPGDETAATTTSTTAGDGSTTSTTGDGTTSTTGDGTTGTDGTTSTTGTDGTVTTSSIPDGETPPVTAFGDPIPSPSSP